MNQPTLLYRFCRWATGTYLRVFHRYRVRVTGQPPPDEGPLLVVSNHASHFDPPIVASAVRRPLRFMAKAELFEGPKWFARLISSLGAFPVRRGDGDMAAYKASVKLLREGQALVMFPEGTRSMDGEMKPFADGCARMALAVPGCRILPVRIRGSFEALGRNRRLPRPHRIEVSLGECLTVADLPDPPVDKKGLYRALTKLIHDRVSAL